MRTSRSRPDPSLAFIHERHDGRTMRRENPQQTPRRAARSRSFRIRVTAGSRMEDRRRSTPSPVASWPELFVEAQVPERRADGRHHERHQDERPSVLHTSVSPVHLHQPANALRISR